jgi:hypothetical protein
LKPILKKQTQPNKKVKSKETFNANDKVVEKNKIKKKHKYKPEKNRRGI